MRHDPNQESPTDFILAAFEPLFRREASLSECLDYRIDETGIDSLELMELVMNIEDRFGIQIEDSITYNEITIAQFCQLAERLYTGLQ